VRSPDLCSLLGNVLLSPKDGPASRPFTSFVLFPDGAGRRHIHRLPALVTRLGLKPVACTGSYLGL